MASKRAATSSRKSNTSATQVSKILKDKKIALNTDFMIESPSSESGLALGPAFEEEFPPSLNPFYPSIEGSLPFDYVEPNWTHYSGKQVKCPNRLWHKADKHYMAWIDRLVTAKEELWRSAGIYDTIMLSHQTIEMGKAFLWPPLNSGQYLPTLSISKLG